MPIHVSANDMMSLRIVSFEGAVSPSELDSLVQLYEERRGWLSYDSFYLLDTDRLEVKRHHLDEMRRRIIALYKHLDFIVLRRSAWIYQNANARWIAEYWVTGRHARDGSSVEFCCGASLEDALALFFEEEVEAVRTRAGFQELARIPATHVA